ncbi:zinc finger and BTB domain-containing protein 47 [Tripterygium wilfordii]|uniref:Zinc finger and BTB domain-containing protein 47 n=1 Tax=Tripterygium wilfordii TaxID=458696 RepID=A0A7J7DL70_TRIWF|nr:large proline-rich protein BAG6 [Tripterygium wilfordii]KAF5747110.1 zinc finger and BTB domain-containing protein 47 [Tripterygium wilfordii]
MGKKKPQKTKELSVAIAEASSTGEETQQAQSPSQTPRKRGRPRKILEKTESLEQKEEPAEPSAAQEVEESSQSKKPKISGGEPPELHQQQEPVKAEAGAPSGSTRGSKKEDGQTAEKESIKPTRRSRRRKSKPSKSS